MILLFPDKDRQAKGKGEKVRESVKTYRLTTTYSAASGKVSPANAGDRYSVYISIPVPLR